MESDRRRQLLLVGLAVVLAGLVYSLWPRSGGSPSAASNPRGAARPVARQTSRETPDVHLEALREARPKPGSTSRNLFRFKPRASAAPVAPTATRQPVAALPIGPAAAPTAPPIPIKFIGIVEAPRQGRKVAILTDGLGPPVYGGEGEAVLGRYRILRIGAESIELSYLDGRGRQTIRLSGS